MYIRLIKFLEKFSILYEYQFGFRRRQSAHLALITLINKSTPAIESGEYVIGVFLDFQRLLILQIMKYCQTNYIIMVFMAVLTNG